MSCGARSAGSSCLKCLCLDAGDLRGVAYEAAATLAQRFGPVPIRLALFGHQLPVDDRIHAPLPCEARAPDGRVDGVRGGLLGVEEAEVSEVF